VSLVVGVAGASGYVGGRVTAGLEAAGHRVVELGRRPSAMGGREVRHFSLDEVPSPTLLDGLDVLVHAAWDLQAVGRHPWSTNVAGSRRLLDVPAPCRVVFVSSMSAYHGTTQAYGLTKLAVERAVATRGGTSVRLGLVYGPSAAGMVGALRRFATLPLAPLIAPDARHFMLHEDDLGPALARLLTAGGRIHGVVGFAHPRPVAFRDVVESLCTRPTRWVRLPWRPVYASLRGAELVHLRMPFRSDSLIGLVRPATVLPGEPVHAELGLAFRPFHEAGVGA
jgi:nucleoside-diphosphate-sugar epimerase